MKYNIYSRIVPLLLKGPVYRSMKYRLPDVLTSDYKKRVKREYRAIIERTEGIGGVKNNELEMTLMFAAFPIALYKCADGKMDEESFKAFVQSVCDSHMMKFVSERKKAFSKKTIDKQRRAARKSQRRKYKNDWVTTFDYQEGSGEYYITHTECGVCKIARQEGVFHLVKYMCVMDYPSYEYQGVVLDRTKTIGYGDDCCNFHVMTKEKANSVGFVKGKDAK